ncbi:TetR family transcriptional regulator [Solimonas sp. K1W22B-7]|uniref:TetR family transcriptional regulator n=1 Tax=Solimonas sp. K1W22B-7 TaxID=2303331 RepID=UPI000E331018|nr:TetR family transcriptional regulator [Solimonas sp. K1W22B-7]AXQ27760.1 TetR family transcriptional regulator [Solimonas sp. K1W22B-7]
MKKDSGRESSRAKAPPPLVSGRQRLMEAALQLAATTRSLASLGLREVARQAGLNPNTFYRHFNDFDELGLAVIDQLSGLLREGLRERRRKPAEAGLKLADAKNPGEALAKAQDVVRQSVALVLDFVTEHRTAYVVGIREMHGSSPVLRKALRKVLDDIGEDMTEDVLGALKLPLLTRDDVAEISQLVVRQMTFFSLDYLEHPEQREQIRRQAERFILLLFWGAIAAKAPQELGASGLRFPA